MASKKAPKQDVEDIAQWNYRKPGEPNNNTAWGEQGSAPVTKEEAGLSPMAGNSEPKTPEEIDRENTWSTAR
jgi:hypothetical protein